MIKERRETGVLLVNKAGLEPQDSLVLQEHLVLVEQKDKEGLG